MSIKKLHTQVLSVEAAKTGDVGLGGDATIEVRVVPSEIHIDLTL